MSAVTGGRYGVRLLTVREAVRTARLAAFLYLTTAVTVSLPPLLAGDSLHNARGQLAVAGLTAVTGLVAAAVSVDERLVARVFAPLAHFYLLLGTLLATVGLYMIGREYELGALLYVQIAIFAFYLLHRAVAVAYLALIGLGFAVVLAGWELGGEAPLHWVFIVISLAAIGGAVGLTMEHSDRLAAQLADLNANLETRVAEQVEEVERLGRLRRFLSPQVADAVLSEGALLEPHRRRIAVLFCDLRGFTRFAGTAEPEDVAEVLTAFYGVLGDLIRRYDATVGTFAGDGIMAYFGDPVPCDDPPGKALDLALSLRPRLDELVARWARAGFGLGYGIGVAYGYATLGTIGFEGRYDYTAVGTVVNLAARLCGEASDGEVLVDQRTYDAVADRVPAAGRDLVVKGFGEPVRAFQVAG
jgi:class 3 adenylate cyclase